jgi:hypothetical protein
VDIAGEIRPLDLRMPLIIGTVPLHREFSKLESAVAKGYRDLIPQTMETKYKQLRELLA